MCFDKLIKKEPEHKGLEVLLKIFLIVGIIAGLCVILKFVYDKFFRDNFCCCGDDDYGDDDICDGDCDGGGCSCDDCLEDEGDITGEADTTDAQGE
jgi:hypothetical protein